MCVPVENTLTCKYAGRYYSRELKERSLYAGKGSEHSSRCNDVTRRHKHFSGGTKAHFVCLLCGALTREREREAG